MLMLFTAAALAAPAAAQSVNEPSSGVAFPTTMAVANGAQQSLAGTGIRTRTMLNVKVYAFGLYVDPTGARAALSAYAGRDAAALANDATLYEALLRLSFPMSMRLVMTRNVSGEQMAEAFDGALRPRVVAAAGRGMAGGEAALTTFRGYFSVEQLTSGTELLFTCDNGTLHSQVASQPKAPIGNPALCWALFDVYLGREPISSNGKKSAVGRLPEVLAAR